MSRPKKRPPHSFVSDLQNRLITAFIEVVRTEDAELADLLDRKAAIAANSDLKRWIPWGREERRRERKQERIKAYTELWDSLTPERQLALASAEAKIGHLGRRARVIGTTLVVQAHNARSATTAGSIDFVIARCAESGVAAEQMQRFLDENAVAWFSLTGHPTNPNTVSYYLAETNVARVLASPYGTHHELVSQLSRLHNTDIVGPRKTPIAEAEESLNTLDVIYDAALAHKALFDDALTRHGYAAQKVKVHEALIAPSAWTLGDGDGNPAITGKALEEGIKLHRNRVVRRHIEMLERAQAALNGQFSDETSALRRMLVDAQVSPDITRILAICDGIAERAAVPEVEDLAYLLRCFGLGFGTIDLRHNARDLITAAGWWAVYHKIPEAEEFTAADLSRQAEILAGWIDAPEPAERFIGHPFIRDGDETGATALRVHDHLRVAARHPDMVEKLIIAETGHIAHVLAALFMLKLTGHKIGVPETRIDLTVLSESVDDLVSVGRMLEDLLDNPHFRKQVAARRRLLAMIAKSDTTRLDGRGEAEYAQYEAAVDIFRVIDHMKRKYPELEGVLPSVFNGGGHALQRGGGRVTEIAAVHGIAAAEALACDIGPSTLTIQGNQQGILFTPGRTAIGTLEALAAQNLYSKAGIHGEMPTPSVERGVNKHVARADSWIFAKRAGEAFDRFAKTNDSIDALLANAPWLSMKSGNASSRPAKRGEAATEPGITPRAARGEKPKALSGRAISGERLVAHAGVPVFSVLGLPEAMRAVRGESETRLNAEKYGDPLHHLYRAYKIHRDGARATVNAAAMADFEIAWLMLIGGMAPPLEQREELAAQFNLETSNGAAVTLAFLEQYFLRTERLAYEMITGERVEVKFRKGEALHRLWPGLAEETNRKNRTAEFARVIEALRNRQFLDAPDAPLNEVEFRITQAIYSAADLIDAPVGIVATRTRLEPQSFRSLMRIRPQSYAERVVRKQLRMPGALVDVAMPQST